MLSSAYIIICKSVDFNGQENEARIDSISITDMHDTTLVSENDKHIEDINIVIGLMGEEQDDQQEIVISIRGKEFKGSLPPLKFNFIEYDAISLFHGRFARIPTVGNETIYFEVHHKNKLIAQYPLKVIIKKGDDV